MSTVTTVLPNAGLSEGSDNNLQAMNFVNGDSGLDFPDGQEGGLGDFNFESFDINNLPKAGADGQFALPEGFAIPEVPGLPTDLSAFDPTDMSSFGSFDPSSFTPNFEIPALKAMLGDLIESFSAFTASAAFAEAFDTADLVKCGKNVLAKLKDLKIEGVDEATASKISKLLLENAAPTAADFEGLGVDAAIAGKIETDFKKVQSVVANTNTFEGADPATVAEDITSALDQTQKNEMLAGLPDSMKEGGDVAKALKKYAAMAAKNGFDFRGLKQIMADPSEFKFDTKEGRRRADKSAIQKHTAAQVAGQAKMAKKQGEEKARQDDPTGSASTIAISTLTFTLAAGLSSFAF